MGTSTIIIIVVVAIVIMAIFKRRASAPEITDASNRHIEDAMKSKDYKELLAGDTSASVIKVEGAKALSDADLKQRIRESFDAYAAKLDMSALALKRNPFDFKEAMVAYMALIVKNNDEANLKITALRMDAYMKVLSAWSSLYANTVAAQATGIARIVEVAGYNINNATKVVEWMLVKDVDESATYATESWCNVTTSGSTSDLLFVLFTNDTQSYSENAGSRTTMTQNKKITYVPHPSNIQVDPDKVEAILASQTLATRQVMSLLGPVLDMAPSPVDFFTI